jgi:hypothetical protein
MKNRMAAYGAAFLLLASLFLIPSVRSHASASFTTLLEVWVLDGKVDNSPIGGSVPSSGNFTSLISTSGFINATVGNLTPAAGAFTSLSSTGGAINGAIGLSAPNQANFTRISVRPIPPARSLDRLRDRMAGTLTGSVVGNSATATAFDHSPSTCTSGTVSTGIGSGGNSTCTARPAITGAQVNLPLQGLCTPPTSTDGSCTGSISFASFGDTAYTVSATTYDTSGANLLFTITGKFTTSISYTLACTFNCSSFNGPAADIRIFHL